MTISNGWAFQWVNNQETWEFFEFLNSNLVLPQCDALANQILSHETQYVSQSCDQKLKEDTIEVTLAFDRWKNVLKQHIFGSLFILLSGEVLIWQENDISTERGWMIEVIPKIEDLIMKAKDIEAKLSTIVSDSASAFAGARYIQS